MSLRIFYAVLFSISVLGSPPSTERFGREEATPSVRAPDGWYVYPNAKLKNVDEMTQRCFNYSRDDWRVAIEGNKVKITKQTEPRAQALPLPPHFKPQPGMPGRTVDEGLTNAIHFANAWLLAYDGGEFGGGLWLTNEDGSVARLLVADNVRGLVRLEGRVVVLSGLAHIFTDFGNVFILSNPDGLNVSFQYSIHLDSAPYGYTKDSDDSV